MDPELIKRAQLKFKFSLFQIPSLMIDYYYRQTIINSLRQFLEEIPSDKLRLPASKFLQTDKS
jgi:hypothetical protein